MSITKEDLFLSLTGKVEREGIDEFMDWLLKETDFMEAPASTRYHGAEKGGLLKHSLAVFNQFLNLTKGGFEYDTAVIVTLFHDICKANFYMESTRNVKDKATNKWIEVPFYTVNESFPYGSHGGKSVYLLLTHGLKLRDEEAVAINCHMGGWDTTNYHNPSGAFEKYPLALYLHLADMLATYIDKC